MGPVHRLTRLVGNLGPVGRDDICWRLEARWVRYIIPDLVPETLDLVHSVRSLIQQHFVHAEVGEMRGVEAARRFRILIVELKVVVCRKSELSIPLDDLSVRRLTAGTQAKNGH